MFYRYVGRAEKASIDKSGVIKSMRGETYFTTERLDSAQEAQSRFALPVKPAFRFGPIPEDEMPPMAAETLAIFQFPMPGQGRETFTLEEVYVLGAKELAP